MSDTTTTTEAILLKTDTRGRVRLPREKRAALLAEFARSGMSGQAFAKWSGVKYQRFATWVQQHKKAAGKVTWVEAQIPEQTKELSIALPGGARLVLNGIGQVPLAVELLRQLGAAC